jgi:hypothetical protein
MRGRGFGSSWFHQSKGPASPVRRWRTHKKGHKPADYVTLEKDKKAWQKARLGVARNWGIGLAPGQIMFDLDIGPFWQSQKPTDRQSQEARKNLARIRHRLRTEAMPTRQRQQLEKLETMLADRLED